MTTTATPVLASQLEEARAMMSGGSDRFYNNEPLTSERYIYTEGVRQHMELAESYWLLNDILINAEHRLKKEQFLVVELIVPHEQGYERLDRVRFDVKTHNILKDRHGIPKKLVEDVVMEEHALNVTAAMLTMRQDTDIPPAYHRTYNITNHPPGRWKFYLEQGAIPIRGANDFGDDWPNMALGYTLMLPNER